MRRRREIGGAWTRSMSRHAALVETMFLLLVSVVVVGEGPKPRTPEEEWASFQLTKGPGSVDWKIELVAAEPKVVDPVALAWDARGRLFVAEMTDYPMAPTGGRIRLLSDEDRDGSYETSRIFAENLPFPNGVLPWRDGVLVTATPDILFLKDNDGDGAADERRVLITGFAKGNQQLRVNGLCFGLDGWCYACNGRSGGKIHSTRKPDQIVDLGQHDFRFDPDSGAIERISGLSQFGAAFDAHGNRFISWNTVPVRHVALPRRVVERNPYWSPASETQIVEDPIEQNRIFPRSTRPRTFNREPPGYFNASCGIAVDASQASSFEGMAFVCEPLFNLVHRRRLVPQGSSFVGARPQEDREREFLTSTDPWFRPVNLAFGPDGALYIADFYREWVEHPDFVRPDLQKGVDFRVGFDRGRIWRVSSNAKTTARPSADLHAMTNRELVHVLGDAIEWRRRTARRLLMERRATEVVDALRAIVVGNKAEHQGIARIEALAVLHGLGALDDDLFARALSVDSVDAFDTAVAATALTYWGDRTDKAAEWKALSGLTGLRSPTLMLAYVDRVGVHSSISATRKLAEVANDGISDPWTRAALLSSLAGRETDFLVAWNPDPFGNDPSTGAATVDFLVALAGTLGSSSRQKDRQALVERINTWPPAAPIRLAASAGLLEARARNAPNVHLDQLTPAGDPKAIESLRAALLAASDAKGSPLLQRALALRLLAFDPAPDSEKALTSALDGGESQEIQQVALRGLSRLGTASALDRLIAAIPSSTPVIRAEIVDQLLSRPDRRDRLEKAIDRGSPALADLDLEQRRHWRDLEPPERQAALTAKLKLAAASDREGVVKSLAGAARQAGDRSAGQKLFTQHCSGCHRFEGQGHAVGPELSGLILKAPSQLLEDILDPNRRVLPGFAGYVATTRDGEVHTGLLAGETDQAVLLRGQRGVENSILRRDLESIRTTGRSLMPEGFEQAMSEKDLTNLIAYLRNPPTGS